MRTGIKPEHQQASFLVVEEVLDRFGKETSHCANVVLLASWAVQAGTSGAFARVLRRTLGWVVRSLV